VQVRSIALPWHSSYIAATMMNRWTCYVYAVAVFALAPAWAQTAGERILHSFRNPPKGAGPVGAPIRDAEGNFYGTTEDGGPADRGVVYKIDAAGTLSILYRFTGGADGSNPLAALIRDAAGNLYGTAWAGGILTGVCATAEPAGCGVVFKVDPSGRETVLYSFTGGADGAVPYGGVIRDADGNLYGTTWVSGAHGVGVVYKLDPTGRQTVLYTFRGGLDGAFAASGLVRDAQGNLYGTTFQGGALDVGVFFKLDPAGNETVLHNFGKTGDGYGPFVPDLVRDSAGNFYGTTYEGGAFSQGVVYKVDRKGHETVLYSFTGGADGGAPYAGVVLDTAGNLYGTTMSGGLSTGACDKYPTGCGVVFKLDPGGKESVLYSFTGGPDGSTPDSAILVVGGKLYGAANSGGTANLGVVYELDAAGRQTVVYSFAGNADGSDPFAGLCLDPSGGLYGTTGYGGPNNAVVIYEIDAHGHETTIYAFPGGTAGSRPNATVILDPSGNLYGTTYYGGAANAGVVYKVDAAGNETVLYTFTGGADGGTPFGGVTADGQGNLYGTTVGGGTGWGVVFKLDASGESAIYSFSGGADGGFPWAGVIRDAEGNLYGTTNLGGASNRGVVFKVSPAGQEAVLYSFTGGGDGGSPQSGLVMDSSGNLYGTTYNGGPADVGVVFKLAAGGQETVLYGFTNGVDGGYPRAGVVRDPAGNLYGAVSVGGQWSAGAVFGIPPQ